MVGKDLLSLHGYQPEGELGERLLALREEGSYDMTSAT